MNPTTTLVNSAAVPQQLKACQNWVVWKYETRDGKPTKPPFDAKQNGAHCYAQTNKSATWSSFEQAFNAADPLNGGDYEGIGFVFTDTNYVGVDLDGVVDEDGIIDSFAIQIMKLANSYCEFSPSGKGVHVIFESALPLPAGNRKGNKQLGGEIYNKLSPRYFTATGAKINGYPADVRKIDNQDVLDLLHFLVLHLHDANLTRLWMGDSSLWGPGAKYPSQSEADEALCCLLAGELNGDARKIETYFGASGLGQRDKWKETAGYRERTIKFALAKTPQATASSASVKPTAAIEFHTPAVPDPSGEYVMAPLEGQEDGWFPLGDISLIGGASGTGKTTWIFEVLYKQKQGYSILGHRTFHRPFYVLAYDRGQNAFDRTMRRLRLLPTDIPMTSLPLAFGRAAVQTIINEIEKLNPIPNIIFIEGLDMLIDDANKKSTVSPFMRQLQEVAAHFHIALIASVGAPKSKRGEDYAAKRDKISGSEAWGRNCETVVVIEFSSEDDGTAPKREMTVLPRNAKAEKFSFEFEGGRLVQIQPTQDKEKHPGGRSSEPLRIAIRFLEERLQDGVRNSKQLVIEALDLENISKSTLYNAARELRVVKKDGCWGLAPMNEGSTPETEEVSGMG